MFCDTIIEFFGHVFYSFTRSVAEHYNFDGREHNSHLLGYNPLEDTGMEWYCQPVDELIYQEYSNREATTLDYLAPSSTINARFIDACSTEDNEPTQEETEDRAMAWKRLRPSIFRSVWQSFYFGFLMSILSASVVAIVTFPIYYLSYQTQLNCLYHSDQSTPRKLQWLRTISEAVVILFFYYWFFVTTLFYFRPFQISGLKRKIVFICLPFYCLHKLVYTMGIQALGFSHFKLTPLQQIPGNVVFYLCLCTQVCIIVRHFCRETRRKQLLLATFITIPFLLAFVSGIFMVYFLYPAYNRQDRHGKMIIALFAPLVMVVLKGVSRVCVQRLWRINHPGTSFALLVPLYCGSAMMLRLLQVDIKSLGSVAVIGLIHGIAEVIERSTMVLIDHICHQVWDRRLVTCGDFRTPRLERLAADIAIMSMLYESSAIISVNGFLHFYQYFYTSDNSPLQLLQSFAITTSVPLAIEWFFICVSIAIETRYQNMPIMVVWRKRWKRHILVAVINASMLAAWLSMRLILIAVKGSSSDGSRKDFCQMPFGL